LRMFEALGLGGVKYLHTLYMNSEESQNA